MSYHTTDREGITELNPPIEKMREIIQSLDNKELTEPDVWLTHDSGWSISLFPSRLAVLENEEEKADPLCIEKVNSAKALLLWQTLADGNIDVIKQEPWVPYID